MPRAWLGRTSPKWPVLCWVGRKTLTRPINSGENDSQQWRCQRRHSDVTCLLEKFCKIISREIDKLMFKKVAFTSDISERWHLNSVTEGATPFWNTPKDDCNEPLNQYQYWSGTAIVNGSAFIPLRTLPWRAAWLSAGSFKTTKDSLSAGQEQYDTVCYDILPCAQKLDLPQR